MVLAFRHNVVWEVQCGAVVGYRVYCDFVKHNLNSSILKLDILKKLVTVVSVSWSAKINSRSAWSSMVGLTIFNFERVIVII